MASSSGPALNEELQCSICLDVFTDPVSTPCGHNFCRTCLSECWPNSRTCFCPLCKEKFSRRPKLKINTTFREVVQHFKEKLNLGESEVFCDFCDGRKQKAVKTCLTCQSSYCETHLEPHLSIPCLKKHTQINPVENLEDYICQKHKRPLELFCRDDQTCVCLSCTEGEHRTHNTVPIEEDSREKKNQLVQTQIDVHQMIQDRMKKIQEIKHSVELRKHISNQTDAHVEEQQKAAEKKAEDLIKELRQEITELKRRNTELEQKNTEQKRRNTEQKRRNTDLEQENTEQKMRNTDLEQENTEQKRRNTEQKMRNTEQKRRNTDLEQENTEQKRRNTELEQKNTEQKMRNTEQKRRNTDLEQENTELKRRNTELEQLSHTDDHLHLIQMSTSLNTRPHTKNWTEIRIDSVVNVNSLYRALTHLKKTHETLNEKLSQTGLKFVQKFAVDVTLDPDTAYTCLILSDDGKQVSRGDIRQDVPENPKRFEKYISVLAKQGFSSGRFYYEVQVKGKTEWDLGVARESINRKGAIRLTPKNGYWTVILRTENHYKACESPSVSLSQRVKPEKVGVFVDYEEGLVSFYDVESRSHIYSFTGQTFTDKLYPYFNPCRNDKGKNSNPLIITPVSPLMD